MQNSTAIEKTSAEKKPLLPQVKSTKDQEKVKWGQFIESVAFPIHR
jgi:hypothetical protein